MMKRLAICILSLTLAVSMPFLASEGQTLIRANDQFNQSNLEGLKGYEYDAATDSWSYSAYHLWMLADSAVVFGLQLTGSGSTGVSVPPFLYLKHVDLTGKPLRFARSLNVEVSGRNYGFSDLKESDPLSILFLGETGR